MSARACGRGVGGGLIIVFIVSPVRRMEEALIEMKRRYDDLMKETIDSADGPTTIQISAASDDVQQLKDELKKRDAAHAERIVEMVRTRTQSANPNLFQQFHSPIYQSHLSLSICIKTKPKTYPLTLT